MTPEHKEQIRERVRKMCDGGKWDFGGKGDLLVNAADDIPALLAANDELEKHIKEMARVINHFEGSKDWVWAQQRIVELEGEVRRVTKSLKERDEV